MKKFNLKHRINGQDVTIGSWITIGAPENVEIMSQSDFDWLTVDMEHSAITLPQAQQLVATIQAAGIPALVRVEENNANTIKRVMDTGANGVIIPMVKSRQDAERAVAAVRYPPHGCRGVGLTRAQGYGAAFDDYKVWLANESVVMVIIEHIDAMKNLEDILSVEGIDGSMIGPYDLSGSLGFPGEYERDEVKTLLEKYLQVCRKVNKVAGYHVIPADALLLKERMDEGFQFLVFSTDALFLGTKVKEGFDLINQTRNTCVGS